MGCGGGGDGDVPASRLGWSASRTVNTGTDVSAAISAPSGPETTAITVPGSRRQLSSRDSATNRCQTRVLPAAQVHSGYTKVPAHGEPSLVQSVENTSLHLQCRLSTAE